MKIIYAIIHNPKKSFQFTICLMTLSFASFFLSIVISVLQNEHISMSQRALIYSRHKRGIVLKAPTRSMNNSLSVGIITLWLVNLVFLS